MTKAKLEITIRLDGEGNISARSEHHGQMTMQDLGAMCACARSCVKTTMIRILEQVKSTNNVEAVQDFLKGVSASIAPEEKSLATRIQQLNPPPTPGEHHE